MLVMNTDWISLKPTCLRVFVRGTSHSLKECLLFILRYL
jgi:hypothetical protein